MKPNEENQRDGEPKQGNDVSLFDTVVDKIVGYGRFTSKLAGRPSETPQEIMSRVIPVLVLLANATGCILVCLIMDNEGKTITEYPLMYVMPLWTLTSFFVTPFVTIRAKSPLTPGLVQAFFNASGLAFGAAVSDPLGPGAHILSVMPFVTQLTILLHPLNTVMVVYAVEVIAVSLVAGLSAGGYLPVYKYPTYFVIQLAITAPVSGATLALLLTKFKQVADKHAVEKQAAAQLSKKKTQYFSQMVHDVRSPLNVISNAVEYLRGIEGIGADGRRWADVAISEAHHLLDVVNALLLATRSEFGGTVEVCLAPTCLRKLLGPVVDSMRVFGSLYSDTARISIADETNSIVMIDNTKVEQIVRNLVTNAIKYSPRNRIEVCVTVELGEESRGEINEDGPKNVSKCEDKVADERRERDGDIELLSVDGSEAEASDHFVPISPLCGDEEPRPTWLKITVEDRGNGLSDAAIDDMFRPFYRGDGVGAIEGTGLGLYHCKQLASAMDGALTVDRERTAVGTGSCFVLKLPVTVLNDLNWRRRSELSSVCRSSEASSNQSEVEKDVPIRDWYMDRPTLLCVDDNPVNLMVLEMLLRQVSPWATIVLRESAEDALVYLGQGDNFATCGAVLADLNMHPGESGYSLAHSIVTRFGVDAPKLLAVTGMARSEVLGKARGFGFIDVLEKPVKKSDLKSHFFF